MATYKTKDGTQTGVVPGVGEIVNGLLKNAPANLENPNLELVTESQPAQKTTQSNAPVAPVASIPVQETSKTTNEETK